MTTEFKQFKAILLKDQSIYKEYESLIPKYRLIEALIRHRKEKRLSQKALAEIIGTKQPAISRLESGEGNVTIDTLLKVTEVLDIRVNLTPSHGKLKE